MYWSFSIKAKTTKFLEEINLHDHEVGGLDRSQETGTTKIF